jgi:hypothetical protein
MGLLYRITADEHYICSSMVTLEKPFKVYFWDLVITSGFPSRIFCRNFLNLLILSED